MIHLQLGHRGAPMDGEPHNFKQALLGPLKMFLPPLHPGIEQCYALA